MAETLLAPSTIKIFGRLITDLTFNYDRATTIIGGNNLLQRQLSTAVTPVSLTGGSVIAGNPTVTVASTFGLEPNMNVSSPTGELFQPNPLLLYLGRFHQGHNLTLTLRHWLQIIT